MPKNKLLPKTLKLHEAFLSLGVVAVVGFSIGWLSVMDSPQTHKTTPTASHELKSSEKVQPKQITPPEAKTVAEKKELTPHEKAFNEAYEKGVSQRRKLEKEATEKRRKKMMAERMRPKLEIGVAVYAKELVRDRLLSPSSAKFPWKTPVVKDIGEDLYSISDEFEAKNRFGVLIAMNYDCEIMYQFEPERASGTCDVYE